jgi:hypothetical protein
MHDMPHGRLPVEHVDTDEWWMGDGVLTDSYFDPSGHLVYAYYHTYETKNRGVLGMLRWRAERLWRRWFPE